jgi:putative glycosyltransferase (TIGR04348 family)
VKIGLITPEPARGRRGNGVTATRWARLLRELGHRVRIAPDWRGEACDLLVALHAYRSCASIARFRCRHPDAPLVVALTGTDVYRDLARSQDARHSLDLASRIVALQPLALNELDRENRKKARVIYQSATAPGGRTPTSKPSFEAILLAHVRPVKDPLVVARAARRLDHNARLRIIHFGGIADPELGKWLASEVEGNPHYEWHGEIPRWRALRVLARSRCLVIPSRLEGGANVVSEALACGVPVLASRIPGSVGLLGPDHSGYFPVGDDLALSELLNRIERDSSFLADLTSRSQALSSLVDPQTERASWATLLSELME